MPPSRSPRNERLGGGVCGTIQLGTDHEECLVRGFVFTQKSHPKTSWLVVPYYWLELDKNEIAVIIPIIVVIYGYMMGYMIILVGGWKNHLKNMSSSIGMMTFPIYGKIKIHVPNHQPGVHLSFDSWKFNFGQLSTFDEFDHKTYPNHPFQQTSETRYSPEN